ncbi:homeobox-leucine zipper protein ATHB-12-like [Andrographis paniculata]|uniref:homeobox-leucine zipper protein ATHB-12-like n=1 Tax=Andrographis paniculata TaxID=175694 RepID=UPI0021E81EF4|nr:homeobox-leucine zipper protein ATHB-12-like [Andrographis paniculata]
MESPEKDELGYEESHPTSSTTKIKNSKNPRRFTDDQIKSLESIFKQDTKLEPRKKLQLAKELGLQPRQIAIWFQNRRARWKSRQIEQEYKVLRENYDSLYMQFDDLQREKQSLQMQLQELSDAVKNLNRVDLTDRDAELKECVNSAKERMDRCYDVMNADADEDEKFTNYFNRAEEKEPLRWGEEEEISQLGSPEAWCNLSSCCLFDQSSGTSKSNWWDS